MSRCKEKLRAPTLGPTAELRRRRPKPGDTWHLDEVFIRIHRRALVEAAIGRYKRVIGDALHSRTQRRQVTEAAIAVNALNRMLEFGCPKSVRTA